jgi:hypothetical protein
MSLENVESSKRPEKGVKIGVAEPRSEDASKCPVVGSTDRGNLASLRWFQF